MLHTRRKNLIQAIEMGTVLLDESCCITSASSVVEQWTGQSASSILGDKFTRLFRTEDRRRLERRILELQSGDDVLPVACRLLAEDGVERLAELRLMRLEDDEGSALAYAGILTQLEADGSDGSLAGLTVPVPVFPVSIAVLDEQNVIRYVSGNWPDVIGNAGGTPVGRNLEKVFPDVEAIEKAAEDSYAEFIRPPDGGEAYKPLYLSVTPTRRKDGRPVRIVAIQDTSRLDEILQRLRYQVGIINQVSDAIITADVDFHITSWNRRAEEMYGWLAAEVLGKEISEVIELRSPDKPRREIRGQLLKKGAWRGRAAHFDRRGERLTVDSAISLLKDATGAVTGSVAINRDVTTQAATEDALRHSEALFRSVVSNLGEGLLLTDETGTALYVNERFADITGYQSSDLIGRTVYKMLFEEDRWPVMEKRLRDAIEGKEETYQTKIRVKSGDRLWVEINSVPYYNEDRDITGSLALITDVSQRKRLEDSLLERDRILETTAEASGALITDADLEEAVNDALRVLGEGLGVDRVYIFQNHEEPESGETLSTQVFEWTREGVQPQQGSPLLENFPLSALPRWDVQMRSGKAVRTLVREASRLEQIVLEPQDIKSIFVVPIMLDGGFWGFVGFDDCTREREWSETEQALLATVAGNLGGAIKRMYSEHELIDARIRAERAHERSTRFLTNVSHEFRSPLAVVLSYSDLLRAIVEAGDDLPRNTILDALTAIRRSSKRLQALVHNLLEISSIEDGTLHLVQNDVEVNSLVRNVIEEMAPVAQDKGLEIKVDLWPEPINITGDPVRVEEIVMNLVENAVKFTLEGYVSISTQLDSATEPTTVLIEVEDTGVGMSEEYLSQLFDPFTQESHGSTRAYEGAGIGLALSHRLAKLMGGTIRALSTKNKGSRFIVALPRSKAQSTFPAGPALVQGPAAGERHGSSLPEILVAGPRRPVYRLWQHLLQQECTFTYVSTPQEALSEIRAGDVSVVLADASAETDYEALREVAEHLQENTDPERKPLLVGAFPGEAAPSESDQALFDDTISHASDLDSFFEKFLQWLPQVSDSESQ